MCNSRKKNLFLKIPTQFHKIIPNGNWKEWSHVIHSFMRARMANEKELRARMANEKKLRARMSNAQKVCASFSGNNEKKRNRKRTVRLVVCEAYL